MKRPRFETTTANINGVEVIKHRDWGSDDEDDEVEEETAKSRVLPKKFETIETSRTTCSKDCWGCVYRFGKQRIRGKRPHVDFLESIYTENKDTMAERDLSEMISKAYVEKIRVPEIAAGNLKVMDWNAKQIYMHIKYHMNDIRRNLQSAARDCIVVQEVLKDNFFTGDGTVEKNTADYPAMQAYLKFGKEIRDIYAAMRHA